MALGRRVEATGTSSLGTSSLGAPKLQLKQPSVKEGIKCVCGYVCALLCELTVTLD